MPEEAPVTSANGREDEFIAHMSKLLSLHQSQTLVMPHPKEAFASVSFLVTRVLVLFCLMCPLAGIAAQTAPARPDDPTRPANRVRIVLVGDSTVNAEGGWGDEFCRHLDPAKVDCINAALNGRSSRSFYDEGAWFQALLLHPDYVLIQFGHNDMKGKGPERESDPKVEYPAHMRRYVEQARAIGARPIIVTSLVRRNYDNGTLRVDNLNDYSTAARHVAQQEQVPVIDLYRLSFDAMKPMSQAEADRWNAALHPDAKTNKPDRTHLNKSGQQYFGALMAKQFAATVPTLAPYIH